MAEYFAGGHLRFVNSEWRDDSGNAIEISRVRHGRWERTKAPFMSECEDCSVCGYRTVWGHRYNYCPNCGAKMDKEE